MIPSLRTTQALRFAALGALGFFLAACSSDRAATSRSKAPAQSGAGYYKVGKPYQIKGQWYYPKEDYAYDETGIASWYGDDFHALQTANGEVYNKNELTAAHKTLPLPSLARVTNLENGRSIVVRVNDRGPFSGARVIDVSQRSAQLLGFERQGTAKVRVQVLADESKAIADAMRLYGGPSQESEEIIASARTPNAHESVQRVELAASAPAAAAAPAPRSVKEVRPVAEYVQLPVSGGNAIYIQSGAFSNVENAMRQRQSLAKIGPVAVSETIQRGVKLYRVRLGPVDTVANADKMLKKVVASGAREARIIVD